MLRSISRRAFVALVAATAGTATLRPAAAFLAPNEPGAMVRLLVAGVVDGRPVAGLELVLEPGWKTYWRQPGDAGIPPRVDASGARGVRLVRVLFPMPIRFGEEGIRSVGYTESVILPLDLTLADSAAVALLVLRVQIGLCHDVCVPLDADLVARLDPAAGLVDAGLAARLAAARARVPVERKAGDPGPAVVRAVRDAGSPPTVTVEVALPEASDDTDLLVEGPDPDWALPQPERLRAEPGREIWSFALDGVPRGADSAGVDLRFTLRTGTTAIEQIVRLDAAPVAP